MTPAALYSHNTPASSESSAVRTTWIVSFVIATATPLMFQIAGANLNAHRALMLAMIIPLIFLWVSGKAPGRILFVDILMILHACWMLLALLSNHAANDILVYWLSQATETLGPYLLARLVIRDRNNFLFFVKFIGTAVVFMLPFAMIESVTGRTILADLFAKIPGTGVPSNVGYGERLGLTRAQVTFEHPILYGVYCAIPLALTFISLRADPSISPTSRHVRTFCILAAVFFSVSSGALAAIIVPLTLIVWDKALREIRQRWYIFSGLFAIGYAFVAILSNRAPLVVLISYVTFSTSTAYNRVLIWRYGIDDVISNPLFGIGLNSWSRPIWLGSSVDNFWLLWAMRYGIVGFVLLALPILLILRGVIRRDFSGDDGLAYCRKGYVFSIIGVIVALATVAFWGGSYAMLCFLIGSGVWMLTADPGKAAGTEQAPDEAPALKSPYTRFASSRQSGTSPRRSGDRPIRTRRAGA